MEKIFNKKNTFLLVGFAVLFKIFLSAVLELHPDEAYYWLWSVHLAPGYYDHSPMVAYFIKITTLFSDSELFVRFSSILTTVILSGLIWKFAKKLFDEKAAAASVMVVNTLPLMLVGSVIITPDTPLFLFWSFTVYFLWKLIDTNQAKYWYITGVFFGLAMLSKYTGALFLPCLLVYMLVDRKLIWFKNKHFYLMFAVSLVIFLPVIYWNFQNGWISFIFQLNHGLHNPKFNLGYIFEYLGGQALIAGPVVFVAGVIAAAVYFTTKDTKKVFLASFSLPIILFFAFTALKRLPEANWPAFAYFAFSIAAAQYMLGSKIKKNILIIGIILNIFISVAGGLHAAYGIIPVYKFSESAALLDATNWFTGWKSMGKNLSERGVKYAVTDSHQWGGAIAYYARGKVTPVLDEVHNDRFNQFAFWDIPQDLDKSKVAIIKIDRRMIHDFSGIPGAEIFYVYRNGIAVRQYVITEEDGYTMQSDIKSVRQKH
ncbi:MAG: glycosyltransferase family 39 protein [Endomicrobia bacterium]|nr:glycosyltransferase family 39 protein [Endomicrobiia bacterium]